MKIIRNLILRERKFFLILIALLLFLFAIALVQNIIKYGIHESYSPWRSVAYLLFSLLLVIPFLPLIYIAFEKLLKRAGNNYWWLSFILALGLVAGYYIFSSIGIHIISFYDSFFSVKYARQYFGREALYHLLLFLAIAFYIYFMIKERKEDVTQLISGTLGKKEVKVKPELIKWIEADDHYLKIYTENFTLIKRYTLEKMAEDLKPDFMRIHRKYIVNKGMIVAKQKEKRSEFVVLQSGERLKVGPSYLPVEW